jgi:hypothetical protein
VILPCTNKLAAKLPTAAFKARVSPGQGQEEGPLAQRHAHLFILDRRQCVLFCHDLTHYTLFLPGLRAPQFAELGRWHRELFLATLDAQGVGLWTPGSRGIRDGSAGGCVDGHLEHLPASRRIEEGGICLVERPLQHAASISWPGPR